DPARAPAARGGRGGGRDGRLRLGRRGRGRCSGLLLRGGDLLVQAAHRRPVPAVVVTAQAARPIVAVRGRRSLRGGRRITRRRFARRRRARVARGGRVPCGG